MALEEFAFLHCDERLIDDFQLERDRINGGGSTAPPPASNRNSTYGVAGELHRPLLVMPPIVLMAPQGTVTPSPIVEMPPSPSPAQLLVVNFPYETTTSIEGVLNISDLMDEEDQARIEGYGDEDDTDVGEVDLDEDDVECYFVEEEDIEVS